MAKITATQIKQIETYAAALEIDQMADLLGIERSKFKEALRAQPAVLAAYRQARAKEIAGIALSMIIAARNGCRHRQQLFLERVGGWQTLIEDAAIEDKNRRSLDEWYHKLCDIDSK